MFSQFNGFVSILRGLLVLFTYLGIRSCIQGTLIANIVRILHI
jgi:hypothetical protein